MYSFFHPFFNRSGQARLPREQAKAEDHCGDCADELEGRRRELQGEREGDRLFLP